MLPIRQSGNLIHNYFEDEAWGNNTVIVGIDEVGRGCLAGPVVAAAVIIPAHTHHQLLQDSKILTLAQRLEAYAWIQEHCWSSYGIIHNRLIDKHNIYQSTLMAMRKALLQLLEHTPHAPSTIVVDAMPLRLDNTHAQHIPVHYFNFGESFSSSIAAASIVAKVTRDRLMHSFDTIIPGFSLARNKGYATIHHRKALSEIHYSIIHRTRFVKTVLDKNNNETPL